MEHIYKSKEGFYPFYVKRVGENYYYYNIITNAIFLMDSKSYKILVDDVDYNDPEYCKEKKFFEENFILITPENKKKLENIYNKVIENKKSLNATSITLMISQECNLRCKYCYGDGGEYSHRGIMDFSTAKKAVDFLVENTDKEELNICFFGGEPLLNFKLIKEIVAYTKSIEEKSNKKFTYCMTTNATLITEEIEEFIKENKISITVSMDGTRETNNANRFYENKKGSYDDTNEKTKNIRKYVTVRATVAPPNLNIRENMEHIVEDLGYKRAAWALANNLMEADDYKEACESELELFENLNKMIKEKKYEEVRKYHGFLNVLSKFDHDGLRSKGCGAGTNMVAIDIDGKVYPCHRFVGISEAVLGNIDSGVKENKEFYDEAELNNYEKCKTCIARSVCAGGCINENYYANGKLNEPTGVFCKYKRAIVDKALEIYVTMDDEAKKMLLS